MKLKNIAIDGPAGAGKSTIARRVAAELNLLYVDTGAMYRAIALYMIRQNIRPEETAKVESVLPDVQVRIAYQDGEQQVFLGEENVSGLIRTPEISAGASAFATIGSVRRKLVAMQQELAKETAVVMDGRDIGTTVLPDAYLKVYLTASVEVRAKRRMAELAAKGQEVDLHAVEEDIRARDYQDMHREESPLRKADDAHEVDTSDLSIEEVTEAILALYQEGN